MGLFGFGRRMENSKGGAFFGFFLVIGAVAMLWFNEGRAVKRYKSLDEAAGDVISVSADKVDSANDKKPVHMTGKTKTAAAVNDSDFGISEIAIKLLREAEMFQWVESKKSTRGNSSQSDRDPEVTYRKEWRSDLVDSSEFLQKEGRLNPAQMKYKSRTIIAEKVTLGAFTLPDFLIAMINNSEDYSVASLNRSSPEIQQSGKLHADGVYFGKDPSDPEIGDIRVKYSIIQPGTVSVVAKQNGSTFANYLTTAGGTVELLEIGEHEAAAMFQLAQDRNTIFTWMLRGVGFFMLAMGFTLILGPLAALSSIIPFLGSVVGAGTKLIGFLLAAIVWTLTVGISWIFYRPFLGITLLVLTVVIIVVVIKKLNKSKSGPAAPLGPSDASPPPFTS